MATIYGFVTDTFFVPSPVIDLGTTPEPAVFHLSESEQDYFYQRARISDNRASRLNVLGTTLVGKLCLYFDNSKLTTPTFFEGITTPVHDKLFNIIERACLGQDPSIEIINSVLKSDEQYDIYVADSLTVSTDVTATTITLGGVQQDIGVRDYIRFSVRVGDTITEFKLWLQRAAFRADYPYSTIVNLVWPCNPEYLLDPSKLTSPIDAVAKSNDFSFADINTDIAVHRSTGLLTYKTKYVSSPDNIISVSFGVMYKGAKPSSLEIRKMIRAEMLALGIANQAVWESIFPDMFVDAQFFLFPVWNNTATRPDRVLYPSVLKLNKLDELAATLMPGMETIYLLEHLELLTIGQSEIFLLAVADPLNLNNKFSLRDLHSSYQFYHAQDPAFSYMDASTKDFNIRLNRCMAMLMGEITSSEFTDNEFYGRQFKSFVSYGVEYHVLIEPDFPTEY